MKASGAFGVLKRQVRPLVVTVVVLIVAYVAYATYFAFQKQNSDAAVAAIHAQHITLADVQGTNLPPMPNKTENDAAVAGIDKNNNGIRDDVELAIFNKYPGSANAKIRAAELQYAMTEQMFLTRVTDTATWKAVAEEDGRASSCIALTYSRSNKDFFKVVQGRTKEVENLVFNIKSRSDAEKNAFEFTTSFGDAPGPSCDVSL